MICCHWEMGTCLLAIAIHDRALISQVCQGQNTASPRHMVELTASWFTELTHLSADSKLPNGLELNLARKWEKCSEQSEYNWDLETLHQLDAESQTKIVFCTTTKLTNDKLTFWVTYFSPSSGRFFGGAVKTGSLMESCTCRRFFPLGSKLILLETLSGNINDAKYCAANESDSSRVWHARCFAARSVQAKFVKQHTSSFCCRRYPNKVQLNVSNRVNLKDTENCTSLAECSVILCKQTRDFQTKQNLGSAISQKPWPTKFPSFQWTKHASFEQPTHLLSV